MKTNWLWDVKHGEREAKRILQNPHDVRFDIYASRLLSRVNDPKRVFRIISKENFVRRWPYIRRDLKRDRWLEARFYLWDAVYKRLLVKTPTGAITTANEIRRIRKSMKLSQREFSRRLGVIQQRISRIESGSDNLCIETLERIARVFGKKLDISFTNVKIIP